ncbi:MAG: phosphoenolpyruvate--protein phosphotransferase [Alphaproteobacteria bacterium]|nr:phosphoenolpyruvate--protein phosphotransferase [Alphaproteobacteria bacterium]
MMTKAGGEKTLTGIGVAAGIAIGPAYVIEMRGLQVPEYSVPAGQTDEEVMRFQAAMEKSRRQIAKLKNKASSLPANAAEEVGILLEAHLAMLTGSRLVRGVEQSIKQDKINAEAAIQRQIGIISEGFRAMDDAYLAARVTDIQEVGSRLIRNLLEQKYNPFDNIPDGSIIITEEITPADTALMDPTHVSGFAAVLGGAEGHAAIMARALGLPAVLGVAALLQGVSTGDIVVIDGRRGEVVVRPTAATLKQARQQLAKRNREQEKLKSLRKLPAETQDGTVIGMHANLELPREIDNALAAGAQGIGLLRTEFMFMNRPDLPDEDEQYETLKKMLGKLDGRMLTVRTLDVGGEKLATALGDSIGISANPALGLRAIRLGLKQPQLLDTQLAAALRAAAHGPLRILVPMVSTVQQMLQVKEHMLQVAKKLQRRGVKLPEKLPLVGAMIEIPGAALAADALAQVSDFFAIGSNDLTQYTLAIDRGDEQVADLYNPLHPAVLRLIHFTTTAALRARIPVSLCGEMAGDQRYVPLLMGLGLRELSMAPSRIAEVKRTIRGLSLTEASGFAGMIMAKADEQEIRHLVEQGGMFTPTGWQLKKNTKQAG